MAAARPLAAALLLMLGFGSIHAFSLFLAPLEQATGTAREAVSLVYGLALGALTAGVLGARPLVAYHSPARLAAASCLITAAGLAIAAGAPPLFLAHLGYGLLFGAANGVAYALCLVLAGSVAPGRAGFWIGAVTAAYAGGAAVSAGFLGTALPELGWKGCLIRLAGLFGLLAAGAGFLLHGLRLPAQIVPAAGSRAGLWRFWIAYGASVAAGLMVLGHAAGIVDQAGGSPDMGAAATMLAGVANAAGGIATGLASDQLPARR